MVTQGSTQAAEAITATLHISQKSLGQRLLVIQAKLYQAMFGNDLLRGFTYR
jgi:hypothetical protein